MDLGHNGSDGTVWHGYRRVPEGDKPGLVRRHFASIADRYDLLNTVLSLGLHHGWKRAAVREAGIGPSSRVIDLCGGTGDLSLLAAAAGGEDSRVVLLDINRAMIEAGLPKLRGAPQGNRILCLQADAEALPLAASSFDAALVGFGVRNLAHPARGFAEAARVLKPGGRLVCLEFSLPVNPVFRRLYDAYSFVYMPLVGLLLAGSARAYRHLPESIRTWRRPEELADDIRGAGFDDVRWRRLTNGIAVIHAGVRR
jgi:demethylmenaquinone methyltransferase/2-methoxy-6-polyprenyl-1,4-benzoquinol methylase